MHTSSSVSRSSHNRYRSTHDSRLQNKDNDEHKTNHTNQNHINRLINATRKRLDAKLDKNDALTTTQREKIIKKAINKIKRKNLVATNRTFPQPLTMHFGNNRLKIATVNPDSINNDRLRELTSILEKNKIDFAGIQETHDLRDTTRKYNNYTYVSAPAKQKKKKTAPTHTPKLALPSLFTTNG